MLSSAAVRRAALAAAAGVVLLATACGDGERPTPRVEGGDADRGRQAVLDYGCVSCHVIPGLPEAQARVGPDLKNFADRRIIAGQEPNRPEVLIRWLQDPESIRPGTAMPDTGLSEQDARDVAEFLYSR